MLFMYTFVFLFGLIIGSFLNVCIYRLPREKSIVSPPSACPACGAHIKPWHNIPVVSYILLGGRCADCGAGISPRYPAVELLNALLYIAALYRFGLGQTAFTAMALLSAFVVVAFIDIDFQIIPDEITLPGIVIGLIAGPLVFKTGDTYLHSLISSLIGAFGGGGLLFLFGWLWSVLRHKEGMGGGDVKFMAMVGAFLGWKAVLVTIFIGSLAGSVVGIGLIAVKVLKRDQYIPFGPFLVIGAAVAMFFGDRLMGWYGLAR